MAASRGADMREGQAAMNRPIFDSLLAQEWIPAIPEVHGKLQAGARVADLGCGVGWSTLALARGYPKFEIDGLDLDAPSIEEARANAKVAGLGSRVRFHARDAADPALAGRYDLVTMFEALHDLSRPVEVLRAARALLAPGRRVLVVDERVGERFTSRRSPSSTHSSVCMCWLRPMAF